jgi:hypothetical protein
VKLVRRVMGRDRVLLVMHQLLHLKKSIWRHGNDLFLKAQTLTHTHAALSGLPRYTCTYMHINCQLVFAKNCSPPSYRSAHAIIQYVYIY